MTTQPLTSSRLSREQASSSVTVMRPFPMRSGAHLHRLWKR